MNEKQRVQILGTMAVVVLSIGAVKLFKKGSVDDAGGPATPRSERGGVAVVVSAAWTAKNYSEVSKAYRPIVDVDPFRTRLFVKPKERGRDRDRGAGGTAPVDTSTPAVAGISLRLTGIVVDDRGVTALLEDRTQGKGAFVRKGDRLGIERTVADVRTSSIVIGPLPGTIASIRTATYEFNDKVDLPLEAIDKLLNTFNFAAPSSSSTTKVGSTTLPTLDPEKQKSVLEALKEKRKKSLNQ